MEWYNSYTKFGRFKYDKTKSNQLKNNPRRRVDFEDVQEIWSHPYYEDCKNDDPTQYRAIGWVKGTLYSVIFESREDEKGEYIHLVTLWKSTKEEVRLYEQNC